MEEKRKNSGNPPKKVEMRIKIISDTDGVITFGTNKGLKVSEVDDTNYLDWSLKNIRFEKRSKALFEKRLAELQKQEVQESSEDAPL